MVDYEKLSKLDYTVHGQVKHFQETMEEAGIENSSVSMDYSYEGEFPVVELTATDICEDVYVIDSYELTNVTEEEFEEIMYDLWVDCLESAVDSLEYRSTDPEKSAQHP